MPVSVDPTAQFEISDVIVELGGRDFLIPGRPAATWLAILTADQFDGSEIIPGMVADPEQLDDLLLGGGVDVDQIVGAIQDVITIASGHPWWWSLGLLSLIRSQEHGTQLLGEMTRLDASTCSLGAWLNTLYAITVKYMKQEDRTKFDMELDTPPPDIEIEPEDLIDEAASSAAFMSMMGQANG